MRRKVFIVSIMLIFVLSITVFASEAEQWYTFVSKDEMTEEETWFAVSPEVEPTKKMNFPYSSVWAWMGIGYNGKDEWVYIGFTEAPNLINTTIKDGYDLISIRVKWDDELDNVKLTQTWGSKFLHFENDKAIVSKIAQSNTLLIELNWYGEGNVYFRFPLNGSADAINEIHAAFES